MVDLVRQDLKIKKGFNSSLKHVFLIIPACDWDLNTLDKQSIVKQLSAYVPNDKECVIKIFDSKIILFEFSVLTRMKIDILNRIDCTVKRIRYKSIMSNVSPYMILSPTVDNSLLQPM